MMNELQWNKKNAPSDFSYGSKYYESQQVKFGDTALYRYVVLKDSSIGWVAGRVMSFDDEWPTLSLFSPESSPSLKNAKLRAEEDYEQNKRLNEGKLS